MLKVLHVDEDADILEVTRLSLEVSGDVVVKSFLCGTDALNCLCQFSPDVFLVDGLALENSSIKMLEALRDMLGFATTPMVVVTSYTDDARNCSLSSFGVTKVISKPFNPMLLADELKSIISSSPKWKTLREYPKVCV